MNDPLPNNSKTSPSLLLSLAKPGAWLVDSCEELLKDDGGRLETSGLSHTSVTDLKKEQKKHARLELHTKYCEKFVVQNSQKDS